jgi:DNA-binding MarR family transcriptional regulator
MHHTAAGAEFTELVVAVFRLNGALTAAGEELTAPVGQSSARWRVLAAVDDAPLTVAQIARRWGLARQSVQRVADELADEGLVEYRDNPDHRRAKLVRLATRGRSVLRTIQEAQRAWSDALGSSIGKNDLRTANDALTRVMDAVSRGG